MVSSAAASFSWERNAPLIGWLLLPDAASSKRQMVTPSLPAVSEQAPSPCHASPSLSILTSTAAAPCTTKIIRASAGSCTGAAPPLMESS
jgi:hypothetical protein